MSSKKGSTETKQENRLGPEMQAVLNTITPRANELLNKPAWSEDMQRSADAMRNYLQSAAFTQPNQNMVNMGQNLMGRGVAGNPFAGGMGRGAGGPPPDAGGMANTQDRSLGGSMGGMRGAMGPQQMKNAGVTPAQRAQNFAGFGTPESLRNDNFASMSAPAMMAAAVDKKPGVDPVAPSISPQVPQFTQADFDEMYRRRLLNPTYSNESGG